MEPKFNNSNDGNSVELLCPSCGGFCLHHENVEVFERSEDQGHGIHVSVSGGQATMDTSLDGNPSSRRHGLSISFSCENCSAEPVLSISQHKGSTLVKFT